MNETRHNSQDCRDCRSAKNNASQNAKNCDRRDAQNCDRRDARN